MNLTKSILGLKPDLRGGKTSSNPLTHGTDCLLSTRGADKSLARPTSRCILFDGENISFDASLIIYFFFLLALQPPLGVVFYSPLAGFSLLAYEVS